MRRVVLYSIAPVLACCVAIGYAGQSANTSPRPVGYEDFMALSEQARSQTWSTLTADNKAFLKRTHAERWLDKNRDSLSSAQTAVVQEAIAFITPQLYLGQGDQSSRSREQQIRRNLECVLGRRQAEAAFTFLPQTKRTLSNVIVDWLDWFTDCVATVK